MRLLKKICSSVHYLFKKKAILIFRNNFFAGLLVILPAIGTIWIIFAIFKLLGSPIGSILNLLFFSNSLQTSVETLLGFFVAISIIAVIGYFAKITIARSAFRFVEKYVTSIPLIDTVYSSIKKIIRTLTNDQSSFKNVGLIEYPRKGLYTICFVTKSNFMDMKFKDKSKIEQQFTSVFVPTTPNPTSGFFLLVPQNEIKILDITVEQGVKLIVSAGVIDIT